jgi:glucokinase
MVIIGGGVSLSGNLLFDPIRSYLKDFVLSEVYLTDLEIVSAALGDDSGLLGALVLSREIIK